MNVDVTGAINILMKIAPKSFLIWSSGTVDVPIRIRMLDIKLL